MALHCPLCHSGGVQAFAYAHTRRYLECFECGLIHLAPEYRLEPLAELARYATHENDPADADYRTFLGRLATPLAKQLPIGAEGLDYGCGPGPTLSLMLEEQGFIMAIHDPFFAPDPTALRPDPSAARAAQLCRSNATGTESEPKTPGSVRASVGRDSRR